MGLEIIKRREGGKERTKMRKTRREIIKISRSFLDFIFPRECVVCGRELFVFENHFCLNCYTGIPLTYFWSYSDNQAERIFTGRIMVERVWSLMFYTNNYRKPIHLLKYRSNIKIGLYLAEMLGDKIALQQLRFHIIVPTPLHWRKQIKRGYNQSEIIAKGIAKRLEIANLPPIIAKLIKRKRFTKTQTHKDKIDRWHNVALAFDINRRVLKSVLRRGVTTEKLNILLVDDVLTTGATLEACGQIIKEHIECNLYIATLAFVE